MTDSKKTYRKLMVRICLIMLLLLAMAVTTFAYVNSVLRVTDNTFSTGIVDIDLNGGNPIIHKIAGTGNGGFVEPGGTYIADFYVKNNSSDPFGVYYKLFFTDISGGLADVLEVSIYTDDGATLLEKGTVWSINESIEAMGHLEHGETRWYTVHFHYPEEAGNATMGMSLDFNMEAEATQANNNPDMLFD